MSYSPLKTRLKIDRIRKKNKGIDGEKYDRERPSASDGWCEHRRKVERKITLELQSQTSFHQ